MANCEGKDRCKKYVNSLLKSISDENFEIIFFLDADDSSEDGSFTGVKRTKDLVENILKVKRKCKLFLVGDSTARDEKVIRDIIVKNSIHNVEILGKLNQTELKYLISRCHIGIVNYGQYDTNNRLCASGKLYEFIYEGIPVVTTSNPPLKRLCDSEKIGCADDSYAEGINTVLEHYSEYKKNVFEFAKNHTIQSNDDCLVNQIEERIKRCSYVEV